jgi:hypothetical protein
MRAVDIINTLCMEKTALNAQKARAMAHDAGLFPEGQWQWALRNLRDSRGDLLQGKALADKKLGMGAIRNNDYQMLKRYEEKHGHGSIPFTPHYDDKDNPVITDAIRNSGGTEFGGVINRDHSIASLGAGERGENSINAISPAGQRILRGGQHTFHTHPGGSRIKYRSGYKPFLQQGTLYHYGFNHAQMHPELVDKKPEKFIEWGRRYDSIRPQIASAYAENKRFAKNTPLISQPSGIYGHGSGGDLNMFRVRADMGYPMNSIFTPSKNIEGIHKIRHDDSLRSVYFDRSPRKAR